MIDTHRMEAVELLGEQAAPRQSDQVRPSDGKRVQEAGKRMGPVRDGECFGRVGRPSGPGCIPRHDMESIRQAGQLSPPAPRVAQESVQEDQGRATAGRAIPDGLYTDLRVQEVVGQEVASTFRFSPASTELKVLRIVPPIIGPTSGANNPRGSKPWVMRLPLPFGVIVARIAIFVPGRAVLSSSNERPS